MACCESWTHPVEAHVPLAPRTTWGIGGAAQWFAEPSTEAELRALLSEAEWREAPVRILGGGSNVLVADGILPGLVVSPGRRGEMGSLDIDPVSGKVEVGAAIPLGELIRRCAACGLTGLEELAGVPGTVGGAVVGNAGHPARGIGSCVEAVHAVDRGGRAVSLTRERIHFAYRWSNLTDLVLTRIVLRLGQGDASRIREDMRYFQETKRASQPMNRRSAGCVFHNPREHPAGWLVEKAGMKGTRVGDAAVSTTHANFIVNEGGATCADVLELIECIRTAVAREFGIAMELEVRLWA
jgi:UDP-N-acetylmuramate dehydrogenase